MPSTPDGRKERALKSAKVASGGNTKPDASWLAIHAEEIELPDESTRPEGFLYKVNYQWQGYLDEMDTSHFELFRREPNGRKCTGTAYVRDQTGMYVVDLEWNRLTRPCLSRPAVGGPVCHAHGAKIPVVKAAAERVIAHAAEVVALRLVGLTDYADEKQEPIDHKVRLAAMNSVLDRAGIRGGVQVEVTGTGFQNILDDLFGVEARSDD